jgi:hypothetical protein
MDIAMVPHWYEDTKKKKLYHNFDHYAFALELLNKVLLKVVQE